MATPTKRSACCWNAGGNRWVLQLTYFFARRSAVDSFYHLRPIPADYGAGYELRKLEADGGEVYHVLLAGKNSTCDCAGATFHPHGLPCKHLSALLALDARGKLPKVAAVAECVA